MSQGQYCMRHDPARQREHQLTRIELLFTTHGSNDTSGLQLMSLQPVR